MLQLGPMPNRRSANHSSSTVFTVIALVLGIFACLLSCAAPLPAQSDQSETLARQKIEEEIRKLQQEVESLELANREDAAWMRRWAPLLSLGGVVLGGVLAALFGLAANRAFQKVQIQKIAQEKELHRAEHLMGLYRDLGSESSRVQFGAAAALLQWLDLDGQATNQSKEDIDERKREHGTILKVLSGALKRGDLAGEGEGQQRPAGNPIVDALSEMLSARLLNQSEAEKQQSGAEREILGRDRSRFTKFVADQLVEKLGAVVDTPSELDERSPLKKSEIDFQEAGLERVMWKLVDAREVDFFNASFHKATLQGAHLDKAIFYGADLSRAVLKGASLKGADLGEANLCGAKMRGGKNKQGQMVPDADLTEANLEGAKFDDKTVWPKNFEVNDYNLVRLDLAGRD